MNYIERDIVLVITLQEIIHINNLIIMISQKKLQKIPEEQILPIKIMNKNMNIITSMIF
jgi:hypothetical protein